MIDNGCPICGAGPKVGCLKDDGSRMPLGAGGHVGRLTRGKSLRVRHTGEFNGDDGGIFKEIE